MGSLQAVRSFGLAVLLVQIAAAKGTGQETLHGWRIYRQTTAIVVVAVDESNTTAPRRDASGASSPNVRSLTTFVLKNVSARTITAIAVTFSDADGFTFRTKQWDVTGNDGLSGGQSCQLQLDSEEAARYKPDDVTIAAVEFADGAVEGNAELIAGVRYGRAGALLELERVASILNDTSQNYASEAGLKTLAEKVGGRPDTFEGALASVARVQLPRLDTARLASTSETPLRLSLLSGVSGARTAVLAQIDVLRRMDPASRSVRLSELRDLYSDQASRGRAFYERRPGEGPR